MAPLVVVTATGTDAGKTHVSCALLRAAGALVRAHGYKPIESGCDDPIPADSARLREASSFHVKHDVAYAFGPAIGPHKAARDTGVAFDLEAISAEVRRLRMEAELLVVELAGGLFSPLAPGLANVDLAKRLDGARVVLVAPDRLGVLHDVGAASRAAEASGLDLAGVILNAPRTRDGSTGDNAADLPLVTRLPLLASVGEGSPLDLASTEPVRALARWALSSL